MTQELSNNFPESVNIKDKDLLTHSLTKLTNVERGRKGRRVREEARKRTRERKENKREKAEQERERRTRERKENKREKGEQERKKAREGDLTKPWQLSPAQYCRS